MNEKKKERKVRTRVSITMTQAYVDALDQLVEDGIYFTRGEIVLDALRRFFKEKGIELRYQMEVEE